MPQKILKEFRDKLWRISIQGGSVGVSRKKFLPESYFLNKEHSFWKNFRIPGGIAEEVSEKKIL